MLLSGLGELHLDGDEKLAEVVVERKSKAAAFGFLHDGQLGDEGAEGGGALRKVIALAGEVLLEALAFGDVADQPAIEKLPSRRSRGRGDRDGYGDAPPAAGYKVEVLGARLGLLAEAGEEVEEGTVVGGGDEDR